jgi:hypothetical protein
MTPLLIGRCASQLRKNCAGVNTMYSQAERVTILEHYFTPKSFAAVREEFSNVYPENKTTTPTGNTSVCLWQGLIGRKNSWSYGRTDFKQYISCNGL